MDFYTPPSPENWQGRKSGSQLYLHEKVKLSNLDDNEPLANAYGILGYAGDIGVARNLGRVGAAAGPASIRKIMATLSNHFDNRVNIHDFGDLACAKDDQLEALHDKITHAVARLLSNGIKPILLGGGHDLAYAHYNGLRKFLPQGKIGIINFDAHFDLRQVDGKRNSGTPFWQIAQEEKEDFYYLALGIQEESNNRELFAFAEATNTEFLLNIDFCLGNWATIAAEITDFIQRVEHVYITVDLDGFSSAYAPGVSAPSPLGFSPETALKSMELILNILVLTCLNMMKNQRMKLYLI